MQQLADEQLVCVLGCLDTPGLLAAPTLCSGVARAAGAVEERLWEGLRRHSGSLKPGPWLVLPSATKLTAKEQLRIQHYAEQQRLLWATEALRRAAERRQLGILRLLLRAGVDPDTPSDWGDSTVDAPLHGAAKRGHLDVLGILLEASVLVDAADPQGRTGLILAVAHGQAAAAERLLAARASPNAASQHGLTALHYAALGRHDIASLLLHAGAKPDPVNQEGQTPMHLALSALPRPASVPQQETDACFDLCGLDLDLASPRSSAFESLHAQSRRHEQELSASEDAVRKTVTALIRHGADVGACDEHGRSARDLLIAKSRRDMLSWLDHCASIGGSSPFEEHR